MTPPPNRLKDHYQSVILGIMEEQHIESIERPGHIVGGDATFTQAVQNTAWFVAGIGDGQPHYRYRRYKEMLNCMQPDGRREAHVDIGCGAGLFSWTFLDWASDNGLNYDQVELYGLDHSAEMLNLAHQSRSKLTQWIGNYPELHYAQDVDVLMHELTENHRPATDYTITFGHVLVQAHDPEAIQTFTLAIAHIVGLMDDESKCVLIAVDARGSSDEFAASWNALLAELQQQGIYHEQHDAPTTPINDGNRAKLATLRPIT